MPFAPIFTELIVPLESVNALIVGLVKVLFVSVCEPVKVAIVESIAKVTVVPVALDAIPVRQQKSLFHYQGRYLMHRHYLLENLNLVQLSVHQYML